MNHQYPIPFAVVLFWMLIYGYWLLTTTNDCTIFVQCMMNQWFPNDLLFFFSMLISKWLPMITNAFSNDYLFFHPLIIGKKVIIGIPVPLIISNIGWLPMITNNFHHPIPFFNGSMIRPGNARAACCNDMQWRRAAAWAPEKHRPGGHFDARSNGIYPREITI